MLTVDLMESYAALFIAIIYEFDNAETAFKMLDNALNDPFMKETKKNSKLFKGSPAKYMKNLSISDKDIENMIRLRNQKVTFKDIGLMYGISNQAVYQRIKNYKKKMMKAKISN